MVRLKEPARKLSSRRRFLALTSNGAVYVRNLDKRLFKLLTGLKQLRLSKKYKAEGTPALQDALRALCREFIDIFDTAVRSTPAKVDAMVIEIDRSKWELP